MIKNLARAVLGEYSLYYIYRWTGKSATTEAEGQNQFDVRPLNEALLLSSQSAILRDQLGYLGSESTGFGCFLNEQLVGVCFYWHADRYRQRNFWPLQDNEAKLVQVIVQPELRGRGAASALIKYSAEVMCNRGFSSLYARIWHSNLQSVRAFQRSGWQRIAFVIEINPFRTARPIRFEKKWA